MALESPSDTHDPLNSRATFTSDTTILESPTLYNIETLKTDVHYNGHYPPPSSTDAMKYVDFRVFDTESRGGSTLRRELHPRSGLVSEFQRRFGSRKPEILFLLGSAGMGKTTLMRLLSAQLEEAPLQAQAVFFGHDTALSLPEQTEKPGPAKERFTLTLIHQLRTKLEPNMPFPSDHLPHALTSFSIERQISDWIIAPLLAAHASESLQAEHCAILIDGLDRITTDHAEQQDILNGLRKLVVKLFPLFSVVISTRAGVSNFVPDDIRHLPTEEELQCPATPISLSETSDADSDMAEYYKSELPALKPESMRDVLDFMVGFTAGNFALAAGFVDHFRHGEGRGQPFPGSNRSASRKTSGFHGLDKLYNAAFSSLAPRDLNAARIIIGHILHSSGSQTPADIRLAFGAQFTYERIRELFRPLEGIIDVAGRHQPIRACHQHTLSAFLCDQTRSGQHHIPPRATPSSSTPRTTSFDTKPSSTPSDTPWSDSEATPLNPEWSVRVLNPGKQKDRSFKEKIRPALPPDMEPWMVEFTTSGVALNMSLSIWDPTPVKRLSPEGLKVERKTQPGDISYAAPTGRIEVLFNVYTSPADGFRVPPGFQPLRRQHELAKAMYKRPWYNKYGSGQLEGKIKLEYPGRFVGTIPKSVISTSSSDTFGGAVIYQSGHCKEELHDDDRQALLAYLQESAQSWCASEEFRQRIPPGVTIFCVLSGLYTDLWASVAFSGQQRSSNSVSEVEPDPDEPEFKSWVIGNSDYQVYESSYTVEAGGLPKPRTVMNACVAAEVALLRFSQKRPKKLGFGSVSSSGQSLTSGQSSSHAPSGRSRGTEKTETTLKRKVHSLSMSNLTSWITRRDTR